MFFCGHRDFFLLQSYVQVRKMTDGHFSDLTVRVGKFDCTTQEKRADELCYVNDFFYARFV